MKLLFAAINLAHSSPVFGLVPPSYALHPPTHLRTFVRSLPHTCVSVVFPPHSSLEKKRGPGKGEKDVNGVQR